MGEVAVGELTGEVVGEEVVEVEWEAAGEEVGGGDGVRERSV